MIWLTWRRYRVVLAVLVVLLVALSLWMVELVHAFAQASQSTPCRDLNGHVIPNCSGPRGIGSLPAQASIVNFLLLALPCVIGAVFGAPLIASELEYSTNRLMWTQGISRTRWLLAKWGCLLAVVLLLMALLTLVTQWWTSHPFETSSLNLAGGTSGRISPAFFPISGVAAAAYTLFAVSLGTAAGALLRRTSLAVVTTIAVYGAVASIMVIGVRPNLAPQTFVQTAPQGASAQSVPAESWYLGLAYRYAPGAPSASPAVQSAAAVADRCEEANSYSSCLASHHVQTGIVYVFSDHYWELQWRESLILFGLSAVLIGGSVWAVRRWQA